MNKKTPRDYHKLAESRGFKWLDLEVKDVRVKTSWQCQEGHRWEAPYFSIQQGTGCPECAKKAKADKRKLSPNQYHDLAREHECKWLGPEVSNARTKTRWQCQKGHINEVSYDNFKQSGCPKCGYETTGDKLRLSPESYQDLAEQRKFRWLGPKVSNANTKTGWQCQKGHGWSATYASIQRGTGCPICNESKGEKRIAEILQSYRIHLVREKQFEKCKNKSYLPFDFYFQIGSKHFLIEYHGEQHYKPISIFGGEEAFIQGKQNDQIKVEFAKEYNYILIIIPYTEYDNIHKILREAIETHIGKSINEIIREIRRKTTITEKCDLDPHEYFQISF